LFNQKIRANNTYLDIIQEMVTESVMHSQNNLTVTSNIQGEGNLTPRNQSLGHPRNQRKLGPAQTRAIIIIGAIIALRQLTDFNTCFKSSKAVILSRQTTFLVCRSNHD
jgi:hypothetical protein